jgi:hypothetical protein
VNKEYTWMAITLACGATPWRFASLPAAIPATCVPCLHLVIAQGAAEPAAVELVPPPGQTVVELAEFDEKHASAITRPPKNG